MHLNGYLLDSHHLFLLEQLLGFTIYERKCKTTLHWKYKLNFLSIISYSKHR